MISVIRSILFYIVFYTISVPLVVGSALAAPIGGRFQRSIPNCWSYFHRLCVRFILGIKVREEGNRVIGPVLYAYKHESYFEAIDIASSLHDPVVFAKEELFDIPLWGLAARAYGGIPVAREAGAKALRFMLTEARAAMETGRPLVIYPEGTRVAVGTAPPLKSGFAALYKLLGLPVVPVAVNSGRLYHRRWKKSGTITFRFGEPIPPGLPREEIEARVHAAINELNRTEAA